MRYDHLDMLPEQAFKKLGKQMTYEGGGGGKKGKKPPRLQLKPVTINTGFGTGTANPLTGQYGYTLDPRLAAMRDMFYGAAEGFAPSEQEKMFAQQVGQEGMGTYGRGSELLNQALGLDTNQIAQDYYNRQQQMLAPNRTVEEARLADTLFRTGRTGAATAFDGGYLNPEQFALLKAREQQNQQMQLQSEDIARQRRAGDIQQALGLQGAGVGQFQTGYQLGALPYQTAAGIFGLGTGIEGLGAGTLDAAIAANQQQLATQMALQQNAASRQKSGKGGKGGIGGLVSGGLQLASAATPAGGWSSLFTAEPTVANAVSGFGGFSDQVSSFGSMPSTLLSGSGVGYNMALPDYMGYPSWR